MRLVGQEKNLASIVSSFKFERDSAKANQGYDKFELSSLEIDRYVSFDIQSRVWIYLQVKCDQSKLPTCCLLQSLQITQRQQQTAKPVVLTNVDEQHDTCTRY